MHCKFSHVHNSFAFGTKNINEATKAHKVLTDFEIMIFFFFIFSVYICINNSWTDIHWCRPGRLNILIFTVPSSALLSCAYLDKHYIYMHNNNNYMRRYKSFDCVVWMSTKSIDYIYTSSSLSIRYNTIAICTYKQPSVTLNNYIATKNSNLSTIGKWAIRDLRNDMKMALQLYQTIV